ncbi:MAG: hypothetical protein H8E60_07370 [Candidatus Marinimicrobia bacterium]|nr:hypothetical protein [Candidatus Neomarinimicrobiota bacterium]
MRFKIFTAIFLINIIFTCTIGVAIDSAGRPYLWKVRDYPQEPNNSITNRSNLSGTINYIGVINSADQNDPDSPVRMGVNDSGLAIANSYIDSDPEPSKNGEFINCVLKNYSSYSEVEDCIENSNCSDCGTYLSELEASFAIIDAGGYAGICEAEPNAGNNDCQHINTMNNPYFMVRTNFLKLS